ncbi:hypothetical protein HYV79_04025 [Candidatus Woesearchaeota archaeon]|nr:hypothetical protein [Candidatus Woesearchaeota archaeon]
MEPLNFFASVEHLELKCPCCACKIEYGLTTEFSDKHQAHICKQCKTVIK